MANFIVVDDHPMARMAVTFLLEKEGHTLIAETDDGREALELVDQHYPEIVVMDIDIHSINGIEVVKNLRARSFPGIIIIVSGKNQSFYAIQSIRCGANGFISKKDNLPEIITAIRAAQNGYGYFPLAGINAPPEQSSTHPDIRLLESLSPQEFQVFNYLLKGLDNMRIANRMNLSNKTVSTYKGRLLEKLHCKSLRDLFAFANRNHME
ncbi:DNA-binding response regulator [Pantoea sp. ICBG 985]|uniref:response regulator n=1 Tax=Pantoea sp. ICBG 985 TaxID=2071683 RepID=UPI000CE4F874|nr:response regulator [Pantoea sp. ICBG 985]PPC68697.1 DNA-binding response regulator [Pantoea sp. ICBG 985]